MGTLDPGWAMVILAVLQVVFSAGVFFGGFVPLRNQVSKLADKIETAGQSREIHATGMAKIETIIITVQEEVRRLRDNRNDENSRNFTAIADALNKLAEAKEG